MPAHLPTDAEIDEVIAYGKRLRSQALHAMFTDLRSQLAEFFRIPRAYRHG